MSIEISTSAEEEAQILHGSLWLAIWDLSWPMLINMLAFAIGTFADTWVSGRLSADAQAAMGIGWQIRYFMMMLALALEVSIIAIVSRYFGAKDQENTIESARQSLIFACVFGVVSTAIGLLVSRSLLHFLGATEGVVEQAWDYLKFVLISNIFSTLLWVSQTIFRSTGDARTAMTTTIEVTALVIVLDFFFCLGPMHMGISGIGIAWIIATFVGVIRNIVKLRTNKMAECLRFGDSLRNGLSKEWFLRFMKIGLPGCMQEVALVAGSFGLFYILSHTQQPAINQAAWGIGWRIEELLVISPMFALGLAIAIIVGQNLGADQPERAEQAVWKVVSASVVINILVFLILCLFAENVAKFMTTDVEVARVIHDYFYYIIWTAPIFSTWFTLSSAMQGAGYTRLPMLIAIISFVLIRLPLSWYLTNLGYDAKGTWIGISTTTVICCILMGIVFRFGHWKKHVV